MMALFLSLSSILVHSWYSASGLESRMASTLSPRKSQQPSSSWLSSVPRMRRVPKRYLRTASRRWQKPPARLEVWKETLSSSLNLYLETQMLQPSVSRFSQSQGMASYGLLALEYCLFQASMTKSLLGSLPRAVTGSTFSSLGSSFLGSSALGASAAGAADFLGSAWDLTAVLTRVTGPTTLMNSGWLATVSNQRVTLTSCLRALASRTKRKGSTRVTATAISARVTARPTRKVSVLRCSSRTARAALSSLRARVETSGTFSEKPMMG
mmetsp:Transcript_21035/g.41259  ORF Transcript_21035/g.41259 Transcript_21035/m.41259 type:complete len:268 (+) Transcript_21035:179-982(+)